MPSRLFSKAIADSAPRLRTRIWRWAVSLRAALLVTVTVGLMAPAALSLLAERERLYQEHLLTIDNDLGRNTVFIAMAMRDPVWSLSVEQGVSILEASLHTDPRILSITVKDDAGKTFAEQQRPAPDDEPSIVHTRPITKDGRWIGVVLVEMTTSGYQQKLDVLLMRHLAQGLFALVGGLLFIAATLHFRLIKPIDRLLVASEKLAHGDLNEVIQSGREDEVGRLAQSLETTRLALAGLIDTLGQRNEELLHINDTLELRVAERTQALEQAIARLQDAQQSIVESAKLASLGRVVAGVAHELNTPIGNALIVASSIHDHLRPLQAELATGQIRKSTLEHALRRADDGFAILLRSLSKAAQMIGDFKQVAVDQTSEQRREFDLTAVTQEVLTTLQPVFKKTPFSLKIDLDDGIACNSFPGPYGQILTNLLMNTLSHAFEGQTTGEVLVRVKAAGPDRARVTVADNGIGMNEEIRSRIFDPFFTTRMGRGGTGLGLNIVQGFVIRVLKGTIQVESAPGAGTRFIVEFPRSPD